MSLAATSPVAAPPAGVSLASLARGLASPWMGAALAAAALASQSLGQHNGDNAWLYTVAEKVLDGAVPYVEVIESNPPGAFLFYTPAVYLARLAHVSTEFAAAAFVFALAALSVFASGWILCAAGLVSRAERGFLLNAAIFAFALLPRFSFAEREHNACLLILPMLAVHAARAAGGRVYIPAAMGAGAMAAFALAIKPHFAIPLIFPLIYLCARRRSPALAFAPEQLTVLAGVIANGAAIYFVFPGYLALAPATFDAYLPLKEPLSYLLRETWFLLNLLLLATLALAFGRACLAPRLAVAMLASLGFVLTFLIQGKGWVNHGLPGDELAFLAAALALAPVLYAQGEEGWARVRRAVLFVFMPVLFGAPILFGVFLPLTGFEEYKGLAAAVRRHAPPHPRVIAVSPRLDVGHPLTRNIGGQWVGRPNALWLMVFSQMFLDANWGDAAKKERLRSYVERDARGFREDVEAGHPDIVLVVEDERIDKALKHPDIAAAMSAYAPVETADGIQVWTRRDTGSAAP